MIHFNHFLVILSGLYYALYGNKEHDNIQIFLIQKMELVRNEQEVVLVEDNATKFSTYWRNRAYVHCSDNIGTSRLQAVMYSTLQVILFSFADTYVLTQCSSLVNTILQKTNSKFGSNFDWIFLHSHNLKENKIQSETF